MGMPISVRIPLEDLPRLDRAAKQLGTSRAGLIAYCTKTFLEFFEQEGEVVLPLNWREILKAQDGRAHRYKIKRHDCVMNDASCATGESSGAHAAKEEIAQAHEDLARRKAGAPAGKGTPPPPASRKKKAAQ